MQLSIVAVFRRFDSANTVPLSWFGGGLLIGEALGSELLPAEAVMQA